MSSHNQRKAVQSVRGVSRFCTHFNAEPLFFDLCARTKRVCGLFAVPTELIVTVNALFILVRRKSPILFMRFAFSYVRDQVKMRSRAGRRRGKSAQVYTAAPSSEMKSYKRIRFYDLFPRMRKLTRSTATLEAESSASNQFGNGAPSAWNNPLPLTSFLTN